MGLPPIAVVQAMTEGLAQWQSGTASPVTYDVAVASSRSAYASLVNVPVANVAVGPAASVFAGVVAASLPNDARVLAIADDFTSMLFPFMVQAQRDRGITVDLVPRGELPGAIADRTDIVVFSLAQSKDGALVDVDGVLEAATRCGARTFCDLTQAAGWYPVQAARFDLTVCAAYKWLCQPRGTAYFTATDAEIPNLTPINAGWYAGESVWDSVYGPEMTIATDARRFEVSPSWLSWVGAAAAGSLFVQSPIEMLGVHGVGLANDFRARLGLPAGITIASRAQAVRIAFHLWNTTADVDLVEGALR